MKDPNFMTLIEISYEFKKKALLMAKAKNNWLSMKEKKKIVLSRIIERLRTAEDSEANLTNRAYADKEYEDFINEYKTISNTYDASKIDADAWKAYWESRRTMEATKREEIKHDVQS